ncbi:MAG: hypothetical protein VX589_16685 [Myxococcota bacterium]|nr:hypothetical protein [Myxococcota bacterium]
MFPRGLVNSAGIDNAERISVVHGAAGPALSAAILSGSSEDRSDIRPYVMGHHVVSAVRIERRSAIVGLGRVDLRCQRG